MSSFRKFLLRRSLTFLPTIFGVVLITYLIAYAIPADPVRAWAGGEKAKPEVIERLREYYHFDRPWYEQFYYFLVRLFEGSLISPRTGNTVFADIATRFSVTLQLALFSIFFAILIGLPLGLLAAYKRDTKIDTAVRILALIGVSMPVFLLGYLLILVFFTQFRVITLAGVPTSKVIITGIPLIDSIITLDFESLSQIVGRYWLPGFVLGFTGAGIIARFVRNSTVETLGADFVEYLSAKGIPTNWARRHVFKNSLVPIVTIIGLQFGAALSGAPITETIFGLPGLGAYAVQSIYYLDFPAIIGTTFVFAIIYVTTNFIVDVLYALIDPRVRY
ncbi:ABC transporter permease [Pyrobaculum aerophilum]|uniref:Dipeptide ABC transporter, permease protein n=2 Tax=Pyrobaculum aerophilum TaxID=13773 RepID=Q8ZXG2_PYRAE|nr:ABC transporter permease [Pyrobaculum aerophilum]AAL63386.1 dipeptide ABC transporter, permease protein [Pyrobaculum aerophilum str. IM2]MCX8135630.1 ABC transporter permease [Pyrobaculum aerophilum]HII47677.1 ABC transporter permease [Pyrobaculum aerophilum]